MDIYTLNEQIDDYEAFVKSKGLEEEFKEFKRIRRKGSWNRIEWKLPLLSCLLISIIKRNNLFIIF